MAMQRNRGRLLQMESDGTYSVELEHRIADAGSRFQALAEDAQEENNQEAMEQPDLLEDYGMEPYGDVQ